MTEKIKSDKSGAFISKEYREFCKNRNIEIEYCTPRMNTGNGVVKRAIQTLKNLIIANLEDGIGITESVNRALWVKRFTIHTGLKITPFELHHGRKPRTELTNIVKDGKHTYLIGQKCLFKHQPDLKHQSMWAAMQKERSPVIW